MKLACPKCDEDIQAGDINMSEAVFFCRRCNEIFPINKQVVESEYIPADFELDEVPAGVTVEDGFEGKVITASNRSLGGFVFALVFGGMFTGIPGTIALQGDIFEKEGLFGVLFLIPFFLVGFTALSFALIMLLGKTRVMIGESVCRAFVGVGSIGWKKEFYPSDVTGIYKRVCGHKGGSNGSGGTPMYHIVVERESTGAVKFGMFVSEKKLDYMFYAIKKLLKDQEI